MTPQVATSVAITAVVVALAGCSAPTAPPISLRAGVIGTTDDLPLLVMQREGFDRKRGVELQLSTYAAGAAVLDAMAAGSVDVSTSVGSVPLLAAAERGLAPGAVTPIAANNFADPEHPSIAIVAGREVKGWRDLNGQPIAVHSVNSLAGAAAAIRLAREGVRDYRWVTMPLANMGLAVAGGNVTAAAMNEPFITQSLIRGDGKLLAWIIGGPPFERMVFTATIVRTTLRREQPAAVKAFLRAHLDAVAWINGNPAKAKTLVGARMGLVDEVVAKMNLLRWPPDARNDPALFDSMQAPLVQAGLLKAPIPAARLFDEALLGEVLAERRQ